MKTCSYLKLLIDSAIAGDSNSVLVAYVLI